MPSPIHASIRGVAAWVPPDRLTNADLEKMVDTNDQWIRERTGIEQRPILKKEGKGSSYLGIQALKKLMKKTGLDPDAIDLLICTTVVPDYKFPPTASLILKGCGVKNAYGFDLNGTCSGFLYALDVATAFVRSGRYQNIVIVSAEKLSAMTDYTDRASCILFGDGASAVWVAQAQHGRGVVDTEMEAVTSGAMNILFKGGGSVYPASRETVDNRWHYFWQDGRAVFKQAVMGMERVCERLMERNELSIEDLKYIFPHQANERIVDAIARRLGAGEKMVYNIRDYGNMSTVTIPLALELWEDRLSKGDKLLLTAFGSGYTVGGVYLEWDL